MSEKDKTDWSFLEAIPNPERQETGNVSQASSRTAIVPVEQSDVPAPLNPGAPDVEELGFFMGLRKKGLEKKAVLRELQTYYENRLDALAYKLARAADVEKARADQVAEEYLKELDAKHLEVLSQIGLRNKDTRERVLLQLTEMTSARLKEVSQLDWPLELKNETYKQLLELRKRYVAEMMRELGESPG